MSIAQVDRRLKMASSLSTVDSLEAIIRKAGYSDLCKLVHYTDHVEEELVWNKGIIDHESNEMIKAKPTQMKKTKYLFQHILTNFDLEYLQTFVDILKNDETNKQNTTAGHLLHKAIEDYKNDSTSGV